MEYKYTSIVLGKRDVGETDRIYALYTLEGGKVQVLAKSVRKPQAKLAGYLENFTLADVSVAKNQGMGKVTGVVVENGFASLRMQYYSISKVLATLNVFNKVVDLGHKDQKIFELLRDYLEAVDSQSLVFPTITPDCFEDKIDLLSSIFLFKMLNLLGYGIETKLCPECGKAHQSWGEFFFSAESGGLVCKECSKSGKSKLMISANSVKLMNLSLKNNPKSFLKIKVSGRDVDFLDMAIRDILAWI